MILHTRLAAGLAALTFLFGVTQASAKPAGRAAAPGRAAGHGARFTPGSRVTHGPATKPFVASKTVVTTKTLAFKPTFVKAPFAHGGKSIKTSLYASSYGVKTKGGFVAYKGKGHGHWSRKWFNSRLRCWQWYCPSACGWYYWCGGYGCYLPVRYQPVCSPTVAVDGVAPELPPGAEGIPVATGDELPPKEDLAKGNKVNKNEKPLDVPEPE